MRKKHTVLIILLHLLVTVLAKSSVADNVKVNKTLTNIVQHDQPKVEDDCSADAIASCSEEKSSKL